MAGHGVGHVALLEPLDLSVAQGQLLGGERVVEVLELGRADDRRGHARPVQQPRERHLCGGTPRA